MTSDYKPVVRELLQTASLALGMGMAPIADMLTHLAYRTLFDEYSNLRPCGEKIILASSMIRFAEKHRKMRLEGFF
jgi:hypothetical protein